MNLFGQLVINGIIIGATYALVAIGLNARLALSLADYAYVMESGRIVLHGAGKGLIDNEHVRAAYLGAHRTSKAQDDKNPIQKDGTSHGT